MPDPVVVELTAPQTVNGTRAAYQSVWLLVRLYHATLESPQRPLVYADDLRERMSNARTLRMAIGRAFQDFARWQLAVGWGEDAGRDPRFLNLEGRSQGPFWLAAHERQRIVCQVGGAPASAGEIAAFLGLDRDGRGQGKTAAPQRMVTQTDLSFWRHFVDGKQALREGRLLTPLARDEAGGVGAHDAPAALTAFRAARKLAVSEFEHAFVALNEALLWRRLGDRAQTRKMLRALRRRRRGHAIAGNDYLDAMEGIVAAWCAYDERDLRGALALLQALAQNPPGATLVQVHPHVRFEWHNLAALIQRSHALSAAASNDAAAAGTLAEQAVAHFEQALAAAFESNVSDAAQHVAANIGMALWLFGEAGIAWSGALPGRSYGLSSEREAERAIQWIGLSEWLGRGAGNRHPSAWNAIYLMRIARGACHTAPRPTLAEFQATAPIGVAALRQLAGPFADAFTGPAWPDTWHEVAAWRLAESQRGERKYPLLQQSSLWFELAWYSAHAGQLAPAARALRSLREGLKQLAASDRQYFGKPLLDALPEPVHRMARDD
ncbi:hypothetical protein J5T34_18840 [Cupriavidus gilardii]|uniref:hypothetical protein n=1 Tax=Cupriavidus gilardii TaxID=82541 RepID=UPI001ABE3F7B|nr:hypothetical protein [Cupriavidus gilardii]MBO4122789.1 hypothetical protein [Cupriavidus gilardii]